MYIFAYICLLCALLFSIFSGFTAIFQLRGNKNDSTALVEKSQWPISAFLLLAGAFLLHALFWQDYRLDYVASYTDSLLPIFYRLTGFWAGQPGSLLFWAICTALAGNIFALTGAYKKLTGPTKLLFWTFFYANIAFFCLLLTCWSNPFIMKQPVPADGNGLNPLLQNPGMIFHPPLLFMGYAGFFVPGCLAMAQSFQPAGERPDWFASTRPFILFSWIFLTAGIVLGAWWAYMELGWGGYWAWDPVENASLLPWLTATACIHLLVIEKKTGKLRRASACLASFTVVAAFFATFLTRSGVIQSVHAFGDGGVGLPLSIFIIFGACLTLITTLGAQKAGSGLASLDSRQGILVIVAWLLVSLAIIILLATMWPVISKLWTSDSLGLDAAFYNRVCLPLGTLLLFLLAFCPWLGFSRSIANLKNKSPLVISLAFWAGMCFFIWMSGYRQPLSLVAAASAATIICSMLYLTVKVFKQKTWPALAAVGAHGGLALLALGIAFSSSYSTERDLLLGRGDEGEIAGYTIKLAEMGEGSGSGYDFLRAKLIVSDGGKVLGELYPERRIYDKFGDMQFSEVDVMTGLDRDIYASILGMDDNLKLLVKISIEPMVAWIWIGGIIMCLMPLAGLRKKAADRKTR